MRDCRYDLMYLTRQRCKHFYPFLKMINQAIRSFASVSDSHMYSYDLITGSYTFRMNDSQKLTGLDLHGINSASQSFEPTEFGMMVGTTPLLVCALLSEALRVSDPTSQHPFEAFLSHTSLHPTILNPTPIDRAIDSGRSYRLCISLTGMVILTRRSGRRIFVVL